MNKQFSPTVEEDEDDNEPFDRKYGVSRRQADNLKEYIKREIQDDMFAEFGRSVAKKILYIGGTLLVALYAYVNDFIHFGPK